MILLAHVRLYLSYFKKTFSALFMSPISKSQAQACEPCSKAALTGRDHVIDLWRGLALVNMAWVHLVGNQIGVGSSIEALIGEYLRFAAGGFVFIAGLSVAKVFGAALEQGGPDGKAASAWLWRRAMLLLILDRVLGVAMGIINRWRLFLPGGEDPQASLWPLALFGEAGVTGGLLLLYAVLLGLTPALAAIKRRCGIGIVIALSIALYAAAQFADQIFHWPPWTFPVAFWQPFFIAGFLSTSVLRHIREGGTARMGAWAAVSSLAFLALSMMRHYPPVAGWDFTKVPLRPAELLRYAITIQFVFAWSMLAFEHVAVLRRMAGWLCLCGRHSLLVYAAHLFIEVPIVEFALTMGVSQAGACMLLVLDAVVLALVAAVAQRVGRGVVTPRFIWVGVRRWLPKTAIVATACVLMSALSLRAVQILTPPEGRLQVTIEVLYDLDAEVSNGIEPASADTINSEPAELSDDAPTPDPSIVKALDT